MNVFSLIKDLLLSLLLSPCPTRIEPVRSIYTTSEGNLKRTSVPQIAALHSGESDPADCAMVLKGLGQWPDAAPSCTA